MTSMRCAYLAAISILGLSIVGCAGSGTLPGGPPGGSIATWLKFAGTPGNTGLSSAREASGNLKWRFQVPGLPGSVAIGKNGTVYVGQKDLAGGLYALDGNTGSIKWSNAQFANFSGAPAVGDELIYIYLDDGLYALDSVDGSLVWQVAVIGTDTEGVGLGPDGTVYIGTGEPSIIAFNGSTGQQLWDCSTGSGATTVIGCPAVDASNVVYATQSDGSIVAVKNGTLLWKTQTNFPIRGSVSVGENGLIYAQGGFNRFACFSATDGKQVWSAITNADNSGQVIGADGTVFSSGLTPPSVIAYSPANGQVLRTGNVNGNVELHAMTSNTIYAEVNDTLIALDAATLAQKWSFKTGDFISGAAAIAPDGTVVFSSADRYVYALK